MDRVGASLGETQKFECKVIGYPIPKIKWYKDDIEISGDSRYDIDFDPNRGVVTLAIKNLTLSDEGLYQCRAENSEGLASTMTYLAIKMDRLSDKEADFSSLMVERISESEHSQVEMQKYGRQTIIEEIITRIEENEREIIEEKLVAPKITCESKFNKPLYLCMGGTLCLEVNVSGCPTPNVSWYHGNNKLFKSSKVVMENAGSWHYLKVWSLEEEDGGSYKVRAENSVGQDMFEFHVNIKTPPSEPVELTVTEMGKDYAILTWRAPESDGQERITGYQVEKSVDGGLYANVAYLEPTQMNFRATRLHEGHAYNFRVAACNAIGNGPFAYSGPIICKSTLSVPSCPRNLHVKETGKDFITVGWLPPQTDGGSRVLYYVLEKIDVSKLGATWGLVSKIRGTETEYKASNLTQGNAYLFKVSAENQVGVGPSVELNHPVISKLPYDLPSPPRNLQVVDVDASYVTLHWDGPDSDGGTPILGFNIEKKDVTRDDFIYVASVSPTVRQYKVIRLFEGIEYQFRVYAENQVGVSLPCETARPVVVKQPYDEPAAPRNLRIIEYWTDFISFAWDSPSTDGGKPITEYVIEKREFDRPVWVRAGRVLSDVRLFRAEGLFEGTDYYFRVFAVNSVGCSKEAATLEMPCRAKMPFDPPFAPRNLRVTDCSSDYICLSWSKPEFDGGSSIICYNIEKRDIHLNLWTSVFKTGPEELSTKITNVFEGQTYFFRVSAENLCGRGPYVETPESATAKLPFDKPSAPQDLTVIDVWRDYITIKWDKPLSDGGCAITRYLIEIRDAFEIGYKFVAFTGPHQFTYQITNLLEGHDYYIRLFAENAAGISEKYAEIKPPVKARLPFEPPYPPSSLYVLNISDGMVKLGWRSPLYDGGSPIVSYVIESCRSESQIWNTSCQVDSSRNEMELTGLIPGEYYFFRIFSINEAGWSKKPLELGKAVLCKTPLSVPLRPANVRVSTVTPAYLELAWDHPECEDNNEATLYYIEMKEERQPEFTPIARVDGKLTRYTCEFMQRNKKYDFQVRGKNSAGFSEPARLEQPVELSKAIDVPTMPLNLRQVDVGDRTVTLSWDAPYSDGGSDILKYVIETRKIDDDFWDQKGIFDSNVRDARINHLENDSLYFVRVSAYNKVGGNKMPAEMFEPVCPRKPVEIPKSPRNLRIKNTTTTDITLEWDLSDEGGDIAQFFIDFKEDRDIEFLPAGRVDGRVNCFTCDFLQKGKPYVFRVRSKNAAGFSKDAAILTRPAVLESARDVPSAPLNLKLNHVDDGTFTISWLPPKQTGGCPLIGYDVEICKSGSKNWLPACTLDSGATGTILKNLTVGGYYFVRVFARNEIGSSRKPAEFYEPIYCKRSAQIPKRPKDLRIIDISDNSATLVWDHPYDREEERENITQYFIDMKEDRDSDYLPVGRVDGRSTSFVFEYLKPDKFYKARVRARNSVGFSEPIELPSAIQLKPSKEQPLPPQNLNVKPIGDGALSLSWIPPKYDGGSPITGYSVEVCTSGSNTWTKAKKLDSTNNSTEIYDLRPGNYYFVRVFSENAVGPCKRPADFYDAVCARKPLELPGAPSNLRVSNITPNSLILSWQPSPNAEQYFIDIKNKGDADFRPFGRVDGMKNSFLCDYLNRGTPYKFRVRAKNPSGFSPEAAELDQYVQLKESGVFPMPPVNFRVTDIDDSRISVAWDKPRFDGGLPITAYVIEYSSSGTGKWNPHKVPGSQYSTNIGDLQTDKNYYLRIFAENEAGLSQRPSDLQEPVCPRLPTKSPDTPRNFHVSNISSDTITLAWDAAPSDGTNNVVQYLIEMKPEDETEYSPIGRVDRGTYTYTCDYLKKGKRYQFRVRGKNSAGSSPIPAQLPDYVSLSEGADVPKPPSNLQVKPSSKSSVMLLWEAPYKEPLPITSYIIELSPNGFDGWKKIAEIDGKENSIKLNDLVPGTNYFARVYSVNTVGKSRHPAELFRPFQLGLVEAVPSEPTNLRCIESSDSSITISWDEPRYHGESPISHYIIETCPVGSDVWTRANVVDGNCNFSRLTSLKPGASYFARVYSANKFGPSKRPAEFFEPILVKSIPKSPRNLRVRKLTEDEITLEWDIPLEGGEVSQFFIDFKEERDLEFLPAGRVDGRVNCFTCDFLQKGKPYVFRVRGKNPAGFSKDAAVLPQPAKLLEGKDVPSSPLNLQIVDVDDSSIKVSWLPPLYNGGTPITGYLVEACPENQPERRKSVKTDSTTLEARVTDLTPGEYYFLHVHAINDQGISHKACDFFQPICCRKPTRPPCKPTEAKLISSDYYPIISWNPSKEDTISDILGYRIEIKERHDSDYRTLAELGNLTTTYELSDLQPEKYYDIRIRARNPLGLSEPIFLPEQLFLRRELDLPSAPQDVKVFPIGDGAICISWSAPYHSGRATISTYVIETRQTGGKLWKEVARVDGDTYLVDIFGLKPGNFYDVRVFAQNEQGVSPKAGEYLEPVCAKKPLVIPAAPKNLYVSDVNRDSVTLSWDQSKQFDIDHYLIDIKRHGDLDYQPLGRVPGNQNTFTCDTLEPGTPYNFRIRARNQAGTSLDYVELVNPVEVFPLRDIDSYEHLTARYHGDGVLHVALPTQPSTRVDISDYTVELRRPRDLDWTKAERIIWKSPYSFDLTNLTIGEDYFVRLAPRNISDTRIRPFELYEPVKIKEFPRLHEPLKRLELKNLNKDTMRLMWDDIDFSTPNIKEYIIEMKEGNSDYFFAGNVEFGVRHYDITDLKPDKPYQFRVRTRDDEGFGPLVESETVKVPEIQTAPEAPTSIQLLGLDYTGLNIKWEPPLFESEYPVKQYVIAAKEIGKPKFKKICKVPGDVLSCKIQSGLEEGKEYAIRVYAENDQGLSSKGVELDETVIYTVVDAPMEDDILEFKPKDITSGKEDEEKSGDVQPIKEKDLPSKFSKLFVQETEPTQVVLDWQKPLDMGSSEMQSYIIVMKENEGEKFKKVGKVDGTTLTYTVTKVKPGHSYSFRVYGENEVGISKEYSAIENIIIPTEKEKEVEKDVKKVLPKEEVVVEEKPLELPEDDVGSEEITTKKKKKKPVPKKDAPKPEEEKPEKLVVGDVKTDEVIEEFTSETGQVDVVKSDETTVAKVVEKPKTDVVVVEEAEFESEEEEEEEEEEEVEITEKVDKKPKDVKKVLPKEQVVVEEKPLELPEDDVGSEEITTKKKKKKPVPKKDAPKPEEVVPCMDVFDAFDVRPVVEPISVGDKLVINYKLSKSFPANVVLMVDGKKLEDGVVNFVNDDDGHQTIELDYPAIKDCNKVVMVLQGETGDVECTIPVLVSFDKDLKIDNLSFNPKVATGHDFEISCQIQGSPDTIVNVQKDGFPFNIDNSRIMSSFDGRNFNLVVQNVNPTDCGNYKIIALDHKKSVEELVTVSITDEPTNLVPLKFIEKPRSVELPEGKTAELFTVFEGGDDTKQVLWFKEGELLIPDDHVNISQLDNKCTLTIQPCTSEDSGLYTCKITNEFESLTCTATVNVLDNNLVALGQKKPLVEPYSTDKTNVPSLEVEAIFKPKIKPETQPSVKDENVQKPLDETILQAIDTPNIQTIELSVILPDDISPSVEPYEGLTAPTLKPSINEITTPTEDAATLIIDEVDAAEIKQVPKILAHPDKLMYKEGDSMYIGCVVEGPSPVKVKWYKNKKSIKPEEDSRIIASVDNKFNLCVLEIKDLKPEDMGNYALKVENKDGSAVAKIKVDILPEDSKDVFLPTVEVRPQDVSVTEGEKIKLFCKVSSEIPEHALVWKKNDEELKPSDKVVLKFHKDTGYSIVEINKSQQPDSGHYTVEVQTDSGKTSLGATVSVMPKKVDDTYDVKQLFASYDVKEGQNIQLTCKISGEPFPDVTIMHDNIPIDKFDDRLCLIKVNDLYKLRICKIKPEDAGVYQFVASNNKGKALQVVKINVLLRDDHKPVELKPVAPEFTSMFEPMLLQTGSPFTLSATFKGSNVKASWFKDGLPIQTSNDVECGISHNKCYISVDRSVPALSGEYTCVISNPHGSSHRSNKVVVLDHAHSVPQTVSRISPLSNYPLLHDYDFKDKNVRLKKGEKIQVLEADRDDYWLVRPENDKRLVFYLPSKYVLGFDEDHEDLYYSSDDDFKPYKPSETIYPCYLANSGYVPSHPDDLFLNENDLLEVLDKRHPDRWLCKRMRSPLKEGWVPSNILIPRPSLEPTTFADYPDTVNNAIQKRRLAVRNLQESEPDYTKDLDFMVKYYFKLFDKPLLPSNLTDKRNLIFSTIPEIYNFHKETFKKELDGVKDDYDELANVFLRNREHFEHYVPYLKNQYPMRRIVDDEDVRRYLKDYEYTLRNVCENPPSLSKCLKRPAQRLNEYILLLKDIIRYTTRTSQDPSKLEHSLKMLMDLMKHVDDQTSLDHITSSPLNLTTLGPIQRHDDLIIRDFDEPPKDRHAFLFRDNLVFTKKKRPDYLGELPTYEFKKHYNLRDFTLRTDLEDDKEFSLYLTKERDRPIYIQARSPLIKDAWCDTLKKRMTSWGSKPFIASRLEKIDCVEGMPVKFRCKIEGQPLPDVTWYLNDKEIVNDGTYLFYSDLEEYYLSIPWTSVNMTGRVTVKARNEYGEDQCSTILNVEEELMAPSFTDELENCSADVGKEARFTCRVTGKPIPSLKWFKDGNVLEISERRKFLWSDPYTIVLIIKDVTEDDAGVYECRASNKAGSLYSKACLFIKDHEKKLESKPEFLTDFRDLVVPEGFDLKWSLRTVGHPTPNIKWYHNNREIFDDGRTTVHYDGRIASLCIPSVNSNHSGQYTCQLENKLGKSAVTSRVVIASRPAVCEKFVDAEVTYGETVKFICHYQGCPEPIATWYHNKYVVVGGERIKTSQDSNKAYLTIDSVRYSDAGLYTCVLRNQAGETLCMSKLYVNKPLLEYEQYENNFAPSFTRRLQNLIVPIGSTARFYCTNTGKPVPKIQWYKDKIPLLPGKRVHFVDTDYTHELRILDATEDDSGCYQCTLTNPIGQSSSLAALIPQIPLKEKEPSPLEKRVEYLNQNIIPSMASTKPDIIIIDTTTITINWQSSSLPSYAKLTPTSYIVERKLLDRMGTFSDWAEIYRGVIDNAITLRDFDVEKDCLYRVKAENEFGTSDPSMCATYYGRIERRDDDTRFQRMPRRERLPPKTPREKPTIKELPDSLEISWHPADFGENVEKTDVFYILERRCPPSKNWLEIASDLKEPFFIMKEYRSEKDYMFRVRAGNEYGISDPSLTSTIFARIDLSSLRKPSIPDVTEIKSKVKPRTIWDRPEIQEVRPDSFLLKWKPSSVPQYAAQTDIWYTIEQRVPPAMDWTKLASDLKEPEFRVTKFSPHKDYYFRVRAANDYGVAEPSMPVKYTKKAEIREPSEDKKPPSREKSESFAPLRKPYDHLRVIPEFIGAEDELVYGIEGRPTHVTFKIRAYPDPKITWFFYNQKIELGNKFTSTLAKDGELKLTILDFSFSDVGDYKVEVQNEYGICSRTVRVEMSDPPTFLEPLKDQIFYLHSNGKLECRVHGIPYPVIHFKKDWRTVANSHRVQAAREEFDQWTLSIKNAIHADGGVYECIAENVAGKVYCTANVKVIEKSETWRDVKFNTATVEDFFHIIDEIGRGSYGIVKRVIDKNSGSQYACKFMQYESLTRRDELAQELEILSLLDHPNIIQVIDGYENKKRLAIVMEIVTGGDLLQKLVNEDNLTEGEIAYYVGQLLQAVKYMHSKNVMHLDIKPENLYLSNPQNDEIKVIDFGFAKVQKPFKKIQVSYVTPEFCSPEIVSGDDVTFASDMWNIGIVTYILLSGMSPFYKETHKETLLAIKDGKWEFDGESFVDISPEAKDFVTRLMQFDPKKRMTVKEALAHPFIDFANHRGLGNRIPIDRLKSYLMRSRYERQARKVTTLANNRTLSSYLEDIPVVTETGVFERDEDFNDAASSVGSKTSEFGPKLLLKELGQGGGLSATPSLFDVSEASSEWGRDYEEENVWYEYPSEYQTGPDTRLFPSQDIALSLRMARYRRAGSGSYVPPGQSARRSSLRGLMKERRNLRDLEKEQMEIEDFWDVDMHDNRHKRQIMLSQDGYSPVFKEKIHDKAYNVGDSCTMKAVVKGNPLPLVTWFRNDEILNEGGRVKISKSDNGRHSLTILQTKPNDFGVYKCVGRNKYGSVTCRARMLCGSQPSRPGRPHVTQTSDKEVFMIWECPESDGNSYILAYKVDHIKPGDERWTTATYCIDECVIIKGLKPETSYRFRISAINKFGQSPYSWASVEIKTKKKGTGSLKIDDETRKILLRSRQAATRPSPEHSPVSSRAASPEPSERQSKTPTSDQFIDSEEVEDVEAPLYESRNPFDELKVNSKIWNGHFSLVLDVTRKQPSGQESLVAKVTEYNQKNPGESLREYDMLKGINQGHIIKLVEGYAWDGCVVLIFEKLYGENVVRSLSFKSRYDEYIVTSIIKQVLDALQYLHHRGIVYLNLQPDNVVFQSRRRYDIKLIDFALAHKITSPAGDQILRRGPPEFMAPENVLNDKVGVAADVWKVGVLSFILMSGVSPFYSFCEDETYLNIKYVKYDVHALHQNATKYSLKFIYQTMRKNPKSRLTVEECLEHKWFMLHQSMIKSRKAAFFTTDRLKYFLEEYMERRSKNLMQPNLLLNKLGLPYSLSQDPLDLAENEDEYFSNRAMSQRLK